MGGEQTEQPASAEATRSATPDGADPGRRGSGQRGTGRPGTG